MKTPPVMSTPDGRRSNLTAAWAFGVLLLTLALARLSVVWSLPVPVCGLKRLTGVPCPFCGGTRCLQALASLDWAGALRWNPLVFAACLGVALWFVSWSLECLLDRRWLSALGTLRWAPALKYGLAAMVLLNWIYLWVRLR
jgi:hypothetical protein